MFTGIAGIAGFTGTATGGGGGGGLNPTFSNVKLLVHGGGANGSTTFTDVSTPAHALTANGNVQHTSGTTIGGENAILFDGTGDFISLTGNPADLAIAGGIDCCFEAYVILDALGAIRLLFNNRQSSGGSGGYMFYIDAANKVAFQTNNNSTNTLLVIGATALTTGTLYHVAASRQGTTGRVFVNGVVDGTVTQVGSDSNNSVSAVRIGSQPSFSRDFAGKMNWFRATIGEALYTANFTPPTMPFPTS